MRGLSKLGLVIGLGILCNSCSDRITAQQSPLSTTMYLNAGIPRVIVVYGTSLSEKGTWVYSVDQTLQKHYPGLVTLHNSAKSGMGSWWGQHNVRENVLKYSPDCLIMEFVINDLSTGNKCPIDQSRNNLNTIIDSTLSINPHCDIILMTTNPDQRSRVSEVELASYYEMVRKLALSRNLYLVDNYQDWIKLRETNRALYDAYLTDGVHPSAVASEAITAPNVLALFGLTLDN